MDKSLNGGLVQVAQVRSALSRFLAKHQGLGVDEAEGINDNLSLYTLYRIDDDSDGAGRQLLEGLLSIDIDRREPTTEARVRVIPADDGLGSYCCKQRLA